METDREEHRGTADAGLSQVAFEAFAVDVIGNPGVVDRIVLTVHPDDAARVKLLQNRRYMVAMVEIDTDETAVRAEDQLQQGRPAKRNSNAAAILCLKEDFNRWAAHRLPAGSFGRLADAGKVLIYRTCGVRSRAELDRNRAAARTFHERIELPFMREEAKDDAQPG